MNYFNLKVIGQRDNGFIDFMKEIFDYTRIYHPCLGRISLAALDNNTISTYHSEDIRGYADCHLEFEEFEIGVNSSLSKIMRSNNYRIVDDIFELQGTPQAVSLTTHGFLSSLTFPILYRDDVIGFTFFNATCKGYFSSKDVIDLFTFVSHIISSRYIQEKESRTNFNKVLQVALKIGHHRDPETAQHLERMGKYSEVLARLLVNKYPEITTDFIHRIRFYAPFHDIGKYRIPDEILFSNKAFSQIDRDIMNQHPVFGEEIIDEVVKIYNLNKALIEEMTFVKNIVRFHHETYDGTGYPDRLKGLDIPLEARIVSLADVFDALLSKRPYKNPWSLEEAMQFIKSKSGSLFDPLCVEALVQNIDEFLEIKLAICDE
ncbi:HD-GYP domain-containing protein [Shewanella zhangzhouensis]|uniref:HD-GYP domain-containing protein n=1 Tax=Shewanella zhangzhouensis TaxID=2864213 RepID=UPI001C65EF74|nr:HD domain-containing phosphohydrolase [Shewanella zhangzhouensis]QYK03549.1 HD domain-containing protein [Shewanella zhangzhouensis]